MISKLSPDHPLRSNPNKPWPYVVMVGYRAAGSRKVLDSKMFLVRATSPEKAMQTGIRQAREGGLLERKGRRLLPSRSLSARPLDLSDRIQGW